MSNYKFETLQLHVGQEQERFRFTRQHLMYSETHSMQQTDLVLQMQVTSTEDLQTQLRMF